MDQEAKFLVLADYFCTTLASATQFKKIRNVNKYKILVENTYYVLQQTLKSFKKYIPQRIQESSVAVDKCLVLAHKLMATRTRGCKLNGDTAQAEIEECLKPPGPWRIELEYYFLSPEEVAMEAEECANIVFPTFGLTTEQRPSKTTSCGKDAKGDITCPLDDKREAEYCIGDRDTLEMARRYWLFYPHDCECDWCVFVAARNFEDMNIFPPASPNSEEKVRALTQNNEEGRLNTASQLAESASRIKILEDGLKTANDEKLGLEDLVQSLLTKFERDIQAIEEKAQKQRRDLENQVQDLEAKLEHQKKKLEAIVEKLDTSEEVSSDKMDKHVQKVSLDNMNLRSHREQNHQQEKSKKRNPVYIGTSLKDTFGKDNDKCIEEAEKKERDKVKRNRINNKHRESSLKQPRIKYISNDLTLDALRKNDSLDDRSQQLPNHKSPKNYKAWKLKPADKGGGIGERGWIDKWSRFLQAVT